MLVFMYVIFSNIGVQTLWLHLQIKSILWLIQIHFPQNPGDVVNVTKALEPVESATDAELTRLRKEVAEMEKLCQDFDKLSPSPTAANKFAFEVESFMEKRDEGAKKNRRKQHLKNIGIESSSEDELNWCKD